MKKLVSLLLVISIFMSFSLLGTAYSYNDISDSEYINDIEELKAIGIMSGDESGNFKPDECLTRAEFAKIICKIDGMEFDIGANAGMGFSDVASNHWAFGHIFYAVGRKYMQGYTDGTFRPDDCITGREALKVLVSLTGYDFLAMAKGGYPDGYEITGAELGITKGLDISLNDYVYREEIARMINNSLDVPYAKNISISDNYKYEINNNNTLLSEKLKMRRGKGVFTATDSAKLGVSSLAAEGRIIINGEEMKITDNSVKDYLGYNVSYLYSFDKEDEKEKKLIYIKDNKTKILELTNEDEISFSGNTLNFVKNDKDENIKISQSADYVVNGDNVIYSDNLFDNFKLGRIKLISTGASSGYDIVIITSYQVVRVGIVDKDNMIVSDKYKPLTRVDFDDTSKEYVIRDNDGNFLTFADIKRDDILLLSQGEKRVECYVSDKKVTGRITEITDDDEFLIDGQKYKLNYLGKANAKISLGKDCVLYIDSFGNVADIETRIGTDNNIAYMIKAVERTPSPDEIKVYVKLYTINGKIESLELNKNITINEARIQNVTENKFKTAINAGQSYHQLINYSVNDEGKIVKLNTARTKVELNNIGIDGFCAKYESKERTFGGSANSFNFEIYVTDATPVMIIPFDPENATEKDFSMTTASIYADDKEYTVEGYTNSVKDVVASVIVSREAMATSSFEGHDCIGAVYSVLNGVTEDGEDIIKLKMYKGKYGGSIDIDAYILADEGLSDGTYLASDIKVGDVIKYRTDDDGKIIKFQTYYKYDKSKWHGTSGEGFTLLNRVYERVVSEIDGEYVFLEDAEDSSITETHKIASLTVIIIRKTPTSVSVRLGSASDILPQDKVIIQTISRMSQTLVVFK